MTTEARGGAPPTRQSAGLVVTRGGSEGALCGQQQTPWRSRSPVIPPSQSRVPALTEETDV